MTHPAHQAPTITDTGEIIARRAPARERWSWALYDFANTVFSMNIATLYFTVWLVADLGASNMAVGVANAITSALVAVSIPVFGVISDGTQRRKPWVVWFTLLACVATAALGVLGQTLIPLSGDSVSGGMTGYVIQGAPLVVIILAFVVANYAYQGALPFYNAMMPELAPPAEWGRLSGLGTALGYIGSIFGVLMVAPFFNGSMPVLGQLPLGFMESLRTLIPFTSSGGRVATFFPTAVIFLLFAIPLFLFCRDHAPRKSAKKLALRRGFHEIAETIRETKRFPGLRRFIIASFLYQDAMGTIIANMALYAVVAVGFAKGAEITLFVVLTVPAVIGSYLCGHLVDRIGPKRTLILVLISWIGLLAGMVIAPSQSAFWFVGALIGLIYGGVGVAERPLLLSLVPDVAAGRFFSLMVLSARAAAVVGPLVWGFTVDELTPSLGKNLAYRVAVAFVALAFAGALWLLRPVPQLRRVSIEPV
jgi:MFS transporter, UMF1 family